MMTPHELKIFATQIGRIHRSNRVRDVDEYKLAFAGCQTVTVRAVKGQFRIEGVDVGNACGAAEVYAKIVSARMDPLLMAADTVLDEIGKLYPPIEVSDSDFAKAIDQLAAAVNARRGIS